MRKIRETVPQPPFMKGWYEWTFQQDAKPNLLRDRDGSLWVKVKPPQLYEAAVFMRLAHAKGLKVAQKHPYKQTTYCFRMSPNGGIEQLWVLCTCGKARNLRMRHPRPGQDTKELLRKLGRPANVRRSINDLST